MLITVVLKDHITQIQTFFGRSNESIQITIEEESNNSVPFLDMKIARTNENTLITEWYRNLSCSVDWLQSTVVVINLLVFTHIILKMKINLFKVLKTIVKKVTHITKRCIVLDKLRTIHLESSYPIHIVNTLLLSCSHNSTSQGHFNLNHFTNPTLNKST